MTDRKITDLPLINSFNGSEYVLGVKDEVSVRLPYKTSGLLSVKDFGAVGDGITDDTAAFNAAAINAGISKTIYVPSGTYILSSPVTLNFIKGDGATSIIKNKSGFLGDSLIKSSTDTTQLFSATDIGFELTEELTALFISKPWTPAPFCNLYLNNINVNSHHANANGIKIYGCREIIVSNIYLNTSVHFPFNGTGKGLWLSGDSNGGVMNCKFNNIQIIGWAYGIYAVNTRPSADWTEGLAFANMTIIACVYATHFENIFCVSITESMIDNNHYGNYLKNCRFITIFQTYLMTRENGNTSPILNILFDNLSSDGVHIVDCIFSNGYAAADAIKINAINSEVNDIIINKNNISNCNNAIIVSGSNGYINNPYITNNTFKNLNINAAAIKLLSGCQYATVRDNSFKSLTTGIELGGYGNNVIDNHFESNVQTSISNTGVLNYIGSQRIANQYVRETLPFLAIGSDPATPVTLINDTGSIEMGNTTTPFTPYIDIHSSGLNVDYDCRIISIGGSSTSGNGDLNIESANLNITGNIKPIVDNSKTLGDASHRWSAVYAGTGTINTSDEREKEQIQELNSSEINCAKTLKSLIKKFKFKDAVAEKGTSARIHVGVIAQEVADVFIDNGLNPNNYALFCYDEWVEQAEVLDDKGNIIVPYRPTGNRFGIRYEELLSFIIAGL